MLARLDSLVRSRRLSLCICTAILESFHANQHATYPSGCLCTLIGRVIWANLANARDGISLGRCLIAADQNSTQLTVLASMYASSSSQVCAHLPPHAHAQLDACIGPSCLMVNEARLWWSGSRQYMHNRLIVKERLHPGNLLRRALYFQHCQYC